MKISTPIELGKIETLADGGNKLSLYTPALAPEEQTILFGFAHKQAYMALGANPIDQLEVPEVLPEIKGEKSESQRLRNAIYVKWDKLGRPMSGFPIFYRTEMEKLIDGQKAEIPDHNPNY